VSDSISAVNSLIQNFRGNEAVLTAPSSTYTETEARNEYIDRLFSLLGWDMVNADGLSSTWKTVVREESQKTETTTKRPDYTFRIEGIRKFYVEAKKPAVDIRYNRESAFQVRSYGWTSQLPISILTNFRTTRVYDTRTPPGEMDNADVGLLMEFDYADLADRFGELYSLFSFEAVKAGSIEATFSEPLQATLPVNAVFLQQFNEWRLKLASDLHNRYANLSVNDLNDLAQKIINRIVFIRMCEDRGIEGGETLRRVAQMHDVVELRRFFKLMDDRYNTGLFDVASDLLQTDYAVEAQLFSDIVEDVYFPRAPYSFSVLDADFLGQVYELFLVKRLALDVNGDLVLKDKLQYEDREIVTTPQPLVDHVVRRAVKGRLDGLREEGTLTFESIKTIKVIDIAVGSSRFLLRALDELTDAAIECLQANQNSQHLYMRSKGDYYLTFDAKKQILESCLFGIDIDYNAVEISRFSLLVKLLEDENSATLPAGMKILPDLNESIFWGNSIVASDFSSTDDAILERTNPFDWDATSLPEEFDVVLGNPPYVKTEEMKKALAEFEYYKAKFTTPFQQFDKYFIFIEAAIKRLAENAWVGMVVPNKWLNIGAGKKLRELLATNELVAEIVDFGNEQLFENKSIYVCFLILSKAPKETVVYQRVSDYQTWLNDTSENKMALEVSLIKQFGPRAWLLPGDDQETLVLSQLFAHSVLLQDRASVINGVQTSAEDVFAISSFSEKGDFIEFLRPDESSWRVEKAITKPYLMDSLKVQSFRPVEVNSCVIFPYEYNAEGAAVLISPERLPEIYPHAFEYLSAYKERLLKRDVSPSPKEGEFYAYGRHQALSSSFSAPKVIYSVNQLGDKYGLDTEGVGFASGGTAGEVAILNPSHGYALEFILGLLNHPLTEFFMRKRGSPFRGGYFSRGSAVVKDLPVPKLDMAVSSDKDFHDAVVQLVRAIIMLNASILGLVGANRERAIRSLRRQRAQLEDLFFDRWDITRESVSSLLAQLAR
jgi:hypothetical protein